MKSLDLVYVNYLSDTEVIYSLKTLIESEIDAYFLINIFILDNSSGEGKLNEKLLLLNEQIKNKNLKIKYIKSERNIGFGSGCNLAAKYGDSEIIIFVNCDTDFSQTNKENFKLMINKLSNDTVIIGPKIISNKGLIHASCFSFDPTSIILKPLRHVRKMGNLSKFIPEYRFLKSKIDRISYAGVDKENPSHVDWISGCFMVVSRSFFSIAKGFDERYFMYFEDVDLCRKARQLQLKVIFDPSLSVIHAARHQSSSTNGILKSIIKNKTTRYHLISWLKYIKKWRIDFISKIYYYIYKYISKFNKNMALKFKKDKFIVHYFKNFIVINFS